MSPQAKARDSVPVPSEEADAQQLAMARAQGLEYKNALDHMARRVADVAGELRKDDVIVAFAIEKAEGMYTIQNAKLRWMKPEGDNIHLEISVRDAADGRFIPGLRVYATIYDSAGNEIGTHLHPFVWHPWLYHYGRNWKLRESGRYLLAVRIDMPDFPRHDEANGNRYASQVEAQFENVEIVVEKKKRK